MRNLYEVGRVYVWQNQRWPFERLNGLQTIVTGNIEHFDVIGRNGQETDTIWQSGGSPMIAEAGDLRAKNPPPGELSVLNQFKCQEPASV